MPRRTALLLLLLCPLLAHCAPQGGDVMRSSMEFRLQSLEAKYLELEQKQDALEVLATDRLEEMQQALVAARDEIARLRMRLGESAPAGSLAPTPVTPSVSKPQAPRRPQAQAKQPSKPTPAKPAAPARKAPAPKTPEPSPQRAAPETTATGVALYQEALERIQAGKPGQAIGLLEKYVTENPNARLTPDARFWLGESHYFLGEYDKAILAYKDVAGRYPNHAKAPAAMLKIGYAYEKLQDPNNARFYLQALVDEYPQSEAAGLAREKIAQLGI